MLLDVYSTLANYVRNNYSGQNIVFENDSYDGGFPFIRVTFIPVINARVEIGANGSNRFDCLLNIDVFTKLDEGVGDNVKIIDDLKSVFYAGLKITTDDLRSIHISVPQILPGRDDGHGAYQGTIEIPWYAFER